MCGMVCLQPEPPKTVIDPAMARALQDDARGLHKQYAQLKMITQAQFEELRGMHKQVRLHSNGHNVTR